MRQLEKCSFAMWKHVPNFSHYCVNQYGEVVSLITNKTLVHSRTKKKYHSVRFCDNNVQKRILLHRLMLQCFIGKKDGFVVDHIDDNPENNILTNLRWVTQSQNIQKSFDLGRSKSPLAMTGKFGKLHGGSKPIGGFDKDGNMVISFESISLAKIAGYHVDGSLYGYGGRKTCKGLNFKYI